MNIVGGLDISLTSTGIGLITQISDGTCKPTVTTITSKGKRGASYIDRGQRIIGIRNEIVYALGLCCLVVAERPNVVLRNADLLDRIGLWWATIGKLQDIGVPVAVAVSGTIKKLITGNGTASKGAMCVHIAKLYPDLHLSEKGNAAEDEADGMGLAHTGAVYLGWDVPTLARHKDGLAKVTWPIMPGGAS